MLEDMKMHSGRVLRRIVEEENEYGNGFRLEIMVEPASTLSKYVSVDLTWMCSGDETEDRVGVIMSPTAAVDIARNLEKAAYSIMDAEDDLNG